MKPRPHFALAILSLLALGADWPQFHGPRRDNVSTETGLLTRWPEGGPPLVWKCQGLGHGFATVSISQGRIFTAGNLDGATVVTALDLDGKRLWQAKNGPAYTGSYPAARSTPTVVGSRLYHLGNGQVACLETASGQIVWTVDLVEKFAARMPTWGWAESLLVDGGRVYCSTGSERVAMVALDIETGRTVWTCEGRGEKPGYTSPILVDCQGLRQIITLTSASVLGIAADDGRLLWHYDHPAPYDVNVTTPVYRDGQVAVFGTWGRGATLLKLNVDGRNGTVSKVWHTEELDNEHGGVVLWDGYLFGHADGNHRQRHWACIEWATGKTMYTAQGLGAKRSGAVTLAGGMIYALGDEGAMGLVRATPKGFEIVSQFELPKGGGGPWWAHPVVCGGRLHIRHGEWLYAYDVAQRP